MADQRNHVNGFPEPENYRKPALFNDPFFQVNSLSFFSNLTLVSAAANLHILTGSFPRSSYSLPTSFPRPRFSAVSKLRGSMKGAKHGHAACALSKKMLTPTSPMPLISLIAERILAGDESVLARMLLRSPSIVRSVSAVTTTWVH